MSTMKATAGHSEACCNVPPAVVGEYKPKGRYIKVDDTEVYTTGSSSAENALFIIFDIFGFSPQAIQGADILAHADAKTGHEYQVFMPDLFYGKPFSISDFPPDTPEKQKKLGDFFAGAAEPSKTAEKVTSLASAFQKESPNIKRWGAIGFCWGGKIISLTSQTSRPTPWSAAAEAHPAMVDPEDAKGIKIPIAILASKDEDSKDVKEFEANLEKEKHVETFADQVHGWMAARGDLENERAKAEYERGYQILLDFFHKHL